MTSLLEMHIGGWELSNREKEVLSMLSTGYSQAEIARILWLSPETIKSHTKNARAKLGAKTTTHAVAMALSNGVI